MFEADEGPRWSPLSGRSFVGRAAPLAVLDRSLDEALAGRPRVVLVEGEAGIGKSRLVAEAVQQARRRGAVVLVGCCREDLDIPYLPLASALEPLGDELGAAVQLLEPPAPDPAAPPSTPDERPAAPLVAACHAAVRAARRRPIMLLIEDLHWADPHTAELFEQLVTTALLAGATSSTAILVVATMRAPAGHVARVVDRLRRESDTRTIRLTGMNEFELNELLSSIGPARPSRSLLAAMMEASSGNPLLARTLLERLLETGGVEVIGGELCSTLAELHAPPGGLDEELRRRLDRIGQPCRQLLTTAAFLGDGALLGDLAAVAASDDVDALLDEAEAAGLLRDDGERYTFDHPQLRQLLYHEPGGRMRQRLHLELAEKLATRYGHDPRRTMEIADHLRRGGSRVVRTLLATYCLEAGEQAYAVGAWGAAARYFDDALAAEPPGDAQARARLELRAGIGHFRDHDLGAAERLLLRAIADARAAGDVDTWGVAALLLTRARFTIGTASVGAGVDTSELDELLASIEPNGRLAGEIVSILAEVRFHAFDFESGHALLDEARRLATLNRDDRLATSVELAAGLQHLGRLDLDAAERALRASATHALNLADPWQRVWGVGRLPMVALLRGRHAEAGRLAAEATAIASANHDYAEEALASASTMQVAAAQGRFAAAEAAGADAERMFRRSDYPFVPSLIYPAFAAIRSARGDVAGANEALDDWAAVGARGLTPYRLLISASVLDREALASARPFRPVGAQPVHLFSLALVCAQVEVAALLEDNALCADAHRALAAAHEAGVRWSPAWPLLVARLLATASRGLGRLDEAARWCEIAAAEAAASGAEPESARVLLERSELCAATGDQARARRLAAVAAGVFDRLGMMPLHQRAERLAGDRIATGRVQRTVLFTDLVDSTAMNVRRGDDAYVELLDQHNAILRMRLRQFDGVEIKHTGDGMAAWFSSPLSACECALAMRDDLAEHNANHPEAPLLVRFGLASGVPIARDGDLFGVSVTLAARLCGYAAPGQILVSRDLAAVDAATRLSFRPLDPVRLKGFPEPVATFALGRLRAERLQRTPVAVVG